MRFQPGDICSFMDEDGMYGVLKILKIVKSPQNGNIYNIAIYQELFEEDPLEDDIENLHTFIGHFPILEKYFLSSEPKYIQRKKVTKKELSNFNEWFKLWLKGKAGFFEIPISECIKYITYSNLTDTVNLHIH